MGWPTFSGTLGNDAVKVRRASVTQDASKGRKYAYPASWEPTSYPCAIVPATAEEVDAFSRENEVVRYTVTASRILGRYRDQLLWVETGFALTIVSILASGDKTARTWDHHVEEHSSGA